MKKSMACLALALGLSLACKPRNYNNSGETQGADQTVYSGQGFWDSNTIFYKCIGETSERKMAKRDWNFGGQAKVCPGTTLTVSKQYGFWRENINLHRCPSDEPELGKVRELAESELRRANGGKFDDVICSPEYAASCTAVRAVPLETAGRWCVYNVEFRIVRKDTTDGLPVSR